VTGEEALDHAETEDETLRCQARANLLDGGVPAWSKRRHHRLMMGLDPVRAPVAAKPPGARITLLTLQLAPAADAGGAYAKPSGSLAMRRACSHSPQNTKPKIDRKRSRHVCRPPSGRQSESLRV
jgi:hypothetical protein